MDTIFARSTAVGRAGVAVVRVSGPRAWHAVEKLTRRPCPDPRVLVLRKIWGSVGLIDLGMVVLFRKGRSFTGEECAEFHLHGSEGVVRVLLAELARLDGLRPARAGEFTHRALENGKLDLTEVEGLNALLLAETEAQRRQALRVVDGELRRRIERWRADLVAVLAALEVTIDFADEEVPQEVEAQLGEKVRRLAAEMRQESEGAAFSAKVAEGFEVALVGAPNTGKSTLLNRLAQRDAALTSETAGTTRDIVEVRLDIGGFFVTLLDTAGIREAGDELEKAGIQRALRRAAAADLRLFIDGVPEGIDRQPGDLLLRGKADVSVAGPGDALGVSGLTGLGVAELLDRVEQELSDRVSGAGAALTVRQGVALGRAADVLDEAVVVLGDDRAQTEVVSEVVQGAIQSLDEVTGKIGVEEVLGEIFSNFCIGK